MLYRLLLLTALTLSLAAPALSARGEDLSQVYPATLDFIEDEDERSGLRWSSGPEDVWQLKSFEFELGDSFELKMRKAEVVFGTTEGNVVWAVVLPKRPTKFRTTYAGGLAETANSVWLRFHPSRIAEIFPPDTVTGRSSTPEARFEAFRIYDNKIGAGYNIWDRPTIPPKDQLILDLDTEEKRRRHFSVELDRGRARYVGEFVVHSTPAPAPCDRREAPKVVEAAWSAFDQEYPLFGEKTELDWKAVLDASVKKARKADGANAAAGILCDMFAALEDPDVFVTLDGRFVDRGAALQTFRGNFAGTAWVVGDLTRTKHGLRYAETPYHVGYINPVLRIAAPEMLEELDEALLGMRDTWSIIIDLRWLQGGDRDLMRAFAGRFVPEKRVYAYSRARADAADRAALGEQEPLEVEPKGDWCYDAPIYLVVGPGTAGLGEELALILRGNKNVITYGTPTSGRSLSARWVELDHKIQVRMPYAVDYDLDGNPLQGQGLQPDELHEFADEEFKDDADPLLYKVLERLVAIPAGDRKVVNSDKTDDADDSEEAAESADSSE